MAKFIVKETVMMVREIEVEAENEDEVYKNYNNGDYDEELEGYYFDGQYDDRKVTVKKVK